jgi:hypothetical protein
MLHQNGRYSFIFTDGGSIESHNRDDPVLTLIALVGLVGDDGVDGVEPSL